MKSLTSAAFWELYFALPPDARVQARKTFSMWMSNPDHPSLNFKPLRGDPGLWSVRISQKYRVVGVRKGDEMRWVWIGTHNDFEKMF